MMFLYEILPGKIILDVANFCFTSKTQIITWYNLHSELTRSKLYQLCVCFLKKEMKEADRKCKRIPSYIELCTYLKCLKRATLGRLRSKISLRFFMSVMQLYLTLIGQCCMIKEVNGMKCDKWKEIVKKSTVKVRVIYI